MRSANNPADLFYYSSADASFLQSASASFSKSATASFPGQPQPLRNFSSSLSLFAVAEVPSWLGWPGKDCGLGSQSTGVGGTNLYILRYVLIAKYNLLILKDLYFGIH